MTVPATALEVLDFWFGNSGAVGAERGKALWFVKSAEVDDEIRARFLPTYERAVSGQLDDWQQSALGSLALVIVLDQFSRNMFRDTPRAFASDPMALAVASQAIEKGFDRQLAPFERAFMYLPFEHSESLTDQQRSLELFALLEAYPELAEMRRYAQLHYDVVKRFGRFPHRNAILGRESSEAERDFLGQPGSSF